MSSSLHVITGRACLNFTAAVNLRKAFPGLGVQLQDLFRPTLMCHSTQIVCPDLFVSFYIISSWLYFQYVCTIFIPVTPCSDTVLTVLMYLTYTLWITSMSCFNCPTFTDTHHTWQLTTSAWQNKPSVFNHVTRCLEANPYFILRIHIFTFIILA